jgi:hypothetical protein
MYQRSLMFYASQSVSPSVASCTLLWCNSLSSSREPDSVQ